MLQPYIDDTTFKDPRTVADHTARELTQLGQHRAAAEFRLKAMSEKDKARWDASIKQTSFEPGDLVMLTHEGRFGLEPKFKGPYIVVEAYPDYGTYRLQTIVGEPLQSLVHVDRLKLAKGDKPDSPWYDPTTERRAYNEALKDTSAGASEQSPTDTRSNVAHELVDDFVDPVGTDTTMNNDNQLDESASGVSPDVSPGVSSEALPGGPSEAVVEPMNDDLDDELTGLLDSFPEIDDENEMTDAIDDGEEDMKKQVEMTRGSKSVEDQVDTLLDDVLPEAPDSSLTDSPMAEDLANSMMKDNNRSESVQGRTQSLEGGDVRPIVVDEDDEDKTEDNDKKTEENRVEVDMPDLPLELEIRLKKEAKRKRKFRPITSSKRHKGHS